MYRIKEDRRVLRSAGLIYEGLTKCLCHKPLEEISPTDIQRTSGVSRTTFYRLFDTMADVLTWACDAHFHTMLTRFVSRKEAEEERFAFVRYAFAYWTRNSLIIEQLVAVGRMDIIYHSMLKHSDIIHDRFRPFFGEDNIDDEYFFAIRSGLVVSILLVWLKGGKRETPEQIARMVARQLEFAVSNPVLL